jgi:ketosteroid isomerase-like protein
VASENVELVRRGYEAFNRGDVDGMLALLDPEIEWITPPRNMFTGTYRGTDEVRGLLRDQREVFEEIAMEPYELFEKGDAVVAFVRQRATGRTSGAEVEIVVGHLWTVRDGRAVRFEGFPEREKALEAAGLPPRR